MHLESIEKIDGCWMWPGNYARRTNYGIACLGANGKAAYAHRWVYEQLIGPIPAGMHIDHLCHNADLSCIAGDECPHRRCVNPAHLEAVTPGDNVLRVNHLARFPHWRSKPTCGKGHPFSDENTRIDKNGRRSCKECKREQVRRFRRSQKAKQAAAAA